MWLYGRGKIHEAADSMPSFISMCCRWMAMVLPWMALPLRSEELRVERQLMGTRFVVVCHVEDPIKAAASVEAAFAIASEVNAIASDYFPDSELSRLAFQPAGSVGLSPRLYALLDHSRRLAEATDGAFDPTLGALTKLWRETRDRKRLPDPAILQAARAASGWQHYSLDPATRCIALKQVPLAFDLGGVAKGYAADWMLESLVAAGISQAMVAAGGDIRVGDPPPGKDGWRIALQTFDPTKADEVILLANAAVSTSGDLHQSVEIDGVKYSHILDPATGLGLTRRIAVSVIADEAKLSDPLATAACVLGPDAAQALRKLPGVREVNIRTLQDPAAGQR